MNSQDLPLVSIVIPLYNASKYIEETVNSVISQTYTNWEMIIVDDCSIDNSRDIINEFICKDNRINLIELSNNFGGPAHPRNVGVEHSKGQYIAFLDSDDLWEEKKLEIQLKIMIKENLNFTSTDRIDIDYSSKMIKQKSMFFTWYKQTGRSTLGDLLSFSFIANSSVIIDKSILPQITEDKDFISVEDYCTWLEVFNNPKTKYKYLKLKLLKYRVLDSSISNRSIENKQESKLNLCISRFIVKYKYYNLLKYYYSRVSKRFKVIK